MQLIDTHCHIHSEFFELDAKDVLNEAQLGSVKKLVCVGTNIDDSVRAVSFAAQHDGVFAAIAVHPHHSEEEQYKLAVLEELLEKNSGKIVAIGETGIDYFYGYSAASSQKAVLRKHLELAQRFDLPCNFHVRGSKEDPNDAFKDFFEIFDEYTLRPSIMHSFSAGQPQLDAVLSRPLYVGVNGIATFTKDVRQIEMYRSIPVSRMVLETDAPLLTPTPKRGKINVPAYVEHTCLYLAGLKDVSPEVIARATTQNAEMILQI